MKRFFRNPAALCAFIAIAIVAFAVVGCGGNKPRAEEITGATDVYLQSTATEYDFAEGVNVRLSDESTAVPEIDSSAVVFGTKGVYDVIYTYDDLQIVRKVYIMTAPSLAGEPLSVTFAEANTENILLSGVQAKDCFDNALEVVVVDDGGFSAVYGDYSVKLKTTDKAGNTAELTRNVTVNRTGEPSFENKTYDCSATEDIEIAADFAGGTVELVKAGDVTVPAAGYTAGEGKLTLDAAALAELVGLGTHKMYVQTGEGYAYFELILTDTAAPAYEIANAIPDGYIFKAGETLVLPSAKKAGDNKQILSFDYQLKKNGEPVTVDTDTFSLSVEEGTYEYAVTVATLGGQTATETYEFPVYSEADYDKIIDLGVSDQFTDRFALIQGITLTQKSDTFQGVTGYYELSAVAGGAWNNRLELATAQNNDYLRTLKDFSSYKKITFRVYMEDRIDFYAYRNTTGLDFKTGGIVLYDETTDTYYDYTNIEELFTSDGKINKWLTVEFSIEGYEFGFLNPSTGAREYRLAVCVNTAKDAGAFCRVADFRFSTEPVGKKDTFVGLEDVYLKTSDTTFDFLEGVYVDRYNGRQTPEVDSGGVTFGTQGKYMAQYSYKTLSASRNVIIMGLPILHVGEDLTLNYAEAILDGALTAGVTATDCFGEPLAVTVEDDGGFMQDGSVVMGTFTVVYKITDAAGQTVTDSRQVTVTGDSDPEFAVEETAYDYASAEALSLPLNLKGKELTAVKIGEDVLDAVLYIYSAGTLSFDTAAIYEEYHTGTYTVTAVTADGGEASVSLTLTDEQLPVYRITSAVRNKSLFLTGSAIELPKAAEGNSYQIVSFRYSLMKDNVSVAFNESEHNISAAEAGNYTFTVTVTNEGNKEKVSVWNYSFIVCDRAVYDTYIETGSGQFISRFALVGKGSFETGSEPLGGEDSYLAFTTDATGAWNNRLEIATHTDNSYLKSLADFGTYQSITAMMYFTDVTNLYVWLNGAGVEYAKGGLKIYDPETQTYIDYANMSTILNKWVRVEIPIDAYDINNAAKRLAFGAGQLSDGKNTPVATTVYMTDIRFSTETVG